MQLFTIKGFKEFFLNVCVSFCHPIWMVAGFLLGIFKLNGIKTVMAVQIVYGLSDYKLFALLGTFGLIILTISFFVFDWEEFEFTAAVLNITGSLCLMAAFKIALVYDEDEFSRRNFYNELTSLAFAISSTLFIIINYPSLSNRWDVKKFVEQIWEDDERERLN